MADNLSAAAFAQGRLYVGGDEGDVIAVLVGPGPAFCEPPGGKRIHVYDRVAKLPGKAVKAEVDIEGLALDDDGLWIVGSHARRRKRLAGLTPRAAMKAITRGAPLQRGRCLIARLSLEGGPDVRLAADRRHGDQLRAALDAHPVLSPFLAISSKENGLDIEGLAVRRRRLLLGCRGPVIGGLAVVLDIKLKQEGTEFELAHPDQPVIVHYLPLGGFGIRDLCRDGDDIIILTGPALEHGAPAGLWRWRQPFAMARRDHVVSGKDLAFLRAIDGTNGQGKPEAIARIPDAPGKFMVLRDGAVKARLPGGRLQVTAEIVDLA